MRQYLSAHIETNNTDYGHASTNHVRLPGLEGWEIDSGCRDRIHYVSINRFQAIPVI